MNTLTESFWKGLNLAHVMEADKRAREVARQQAELHQMQMQEYARQIQQREAIQNLFQPTTQDVPVTPEFEQMRVNLGLQGQAPVGLERMPSQAMQALQSGDMGALARQIATVAPIKAMEMMAKRKDYTLAPGEIRFRGGQEVARGAPKNVETWGQPYQKEGAWLQKSSRGKIKSVLGRPTEKTPSIYPKGFDNMLAKLQSIRNKKANLELGLTEMGFPFPENLNTEAARKIYEIEEENQIRFMKKRYPKAWKDYAGKEETKPQLKTLDRVTASKFLKQANGDKNLARKLAREAGYSF